MELRNDINTDWGSVPYTGQQVLNAIKSQFNEIVTAVNSTVLDVVFTHEEDTDEFSVTVTKVNGTVTPYDIRLTPRSEKVINLTNFTVPAYSYPGDDVTIRYTYNITADGTRINNKLANVKLYVNNGLIATFNAPATYSNSDRSGTYVISGDHIKEGNNTIRIDFSYSDSEGAATFVLADGVFTTLSLLSFKLKLDAELTNIEDISEIVASTSTEFGLQLSLTDSAGTPITSSVYGINANNINTTIFSGINNTTNIYTGTSIDLLVLSTIVGTPTRNEYSFYVLSSITIDNSIIASDVVLFLLISSPQGNNPQYAFKLTGMPSVDKTVNKIIATLYDTINLNLYAYVPTDSTVNYKIGENIINSINVSGDTSALLDLSWSYQLLQAGSNVISVSIGNQSFNLTVDTILLANDLIPPANALIDFIPNGLSLAMDEMTVNGYTFSFTGFDWSSNGWSDDGRALVINNGALLNINAKPLNSTTPQAISFRFKTVNENTNETLISCFKNNCNGFKITPLSATIYQGTQSKTTLFSSEDSIKEVTFVWYGSNYGNVAIIYVNGTSQMILGQGTSTANDNNITITANNTSLYLYGMQYYNKAITFSEVLALYNIHNNANIGEYSKQNDIFASSISLNTNHKGNGLKVTIDKLPVGSVYMLIRAHENGVREPWKTINELNATDNEGNETKSWRLLAGETFLIKKMGPNLVAYAGNFYADRIALSGQGTSSMKYPLKNYRIYFKKKLTDVAPFNTGWDKTNPNGEKIAYTKTFVTGSSVTGIDFVPVSINNVDSNNPAQYSLFNTNRTDENGLAESTYNSMPANIFCLKADYAESSGMHNTGFARMTLVALENSSSILHSGDVLYNSECTHLPMNEVAEASEFPYEIRQSIDGRLIYLFFLGRNQDGTLGDIVYAGKYNLNNEKASEDVFGFTNKDGNEPSYFDNEIVLNEAGHLKTLFGITDSSFDDTHSTFKSSSGNTYVNPTECWEFSTNNPTNIEHLNELGNIRGNIGAFTFPYMKEDNTLLGLEMPDYSNLSYRNLNPFTETTNSAGTPLAWFCLELAWEPRYPDFDETDAGYIAYAQGAKPYLLNSLYKWLYKNNVYLWPESQKESHAAIFARDLHLYFNVNYILKYYVLTKMFVNADQRIKNCMLSFYCDPKAEDNIGENGNYPMGHMRAFYIFYDNDTILGITNTGILELPWDADETNNVYNGIDGNNVSYHAIWGNIEYCYNAYINNSTSNLYVLALGKLVETTYLILRTVLSDNTIYSYLNSSLPDAADNIDAEVKYMYPTVLNGSSKVSNYDVECLNQYQGNRKYHREWFLSKRTKWFDALYGAGSILDYYFGFKFANSVSNFNHNTINIETEFNKWRFYYNAESTTFTPTKLLTLTNNESDRIGTLTVTYTANSNLNSIFGLYGAKTIDFSNFYGNTLNSRLTQFSIGRSLPYLKKFIFGSTDGLLYVDNLSFINSSFIPNVEELILTNVVNRADGTNVDNYISCDLSSLSMLRFLNASTTLLDVILPEGSKLLEVKLDLPTNLTFTNNIQLSNLTLAGTESLEVININHCSDYLYNKALDLIINNYSLLTSATIVIGLGEDPDDLSNSTIAKLVDLATLITNYNILNISITGTGRNIAITSNQKAIIFNAFGSDLTIIDTASDEFMINLTSLYLRENDEPIQINTNRLATFTMLISGDDAEELTPYILLNTNESASYMATLEARPIYDNNNKSCVVTITATSTSGEVIQSDAIAVQYVPITSISASVVGNDYDIVSKDGSLISLVVDSMSTKQHLLNLDLIGTNVILSVTSGSLEYSYDSTTHLLTSLRYTPNSLSPDDDILNISLFGTTVCSKILYYDKVVCNLDDIKSGSQSYRPELKWLSDLFAGGILDNLGDTLLKRSHLVKYTISTGSNTILCSTGKSVLAQQDGDSTVYDLTYLQYFRVSNTLFTVPTSFRFNNLVLPERISEFEWTSTFANHYDYGTIVFPSTLNSAVVRLLSLTSLMLNLLFDLTKCTKINKIFNNGTSQSAGVFSLSLTVEINLSSGVDRSLFLYPSNTIEQIGNVVSTIGGALLESDASNNAFSGLAMFNVVLGNAAWSYADSGVPIYKLGAPTNNNKLTVGYVSSYKLNSPCFEWNTLSQYVKKLSYTFYKGSGIPQDGNITLNVIEEIGDGSFYCDGRSTWVSIAIGPLCTKIGTSAFTNYTGGTLIAGGVNDSNITFNNVTHIYSSAFSQLIAFKTFNFTNLQYIGDNVFIAYENAGHTINVTTDLVPTFISLNAPFGTGRRNTINLTTNALSVKDAFLIYKNDVNLNINGELQN